MDLESFHHNECNTSKHLKYEKIYIIYGNKREIET